MMPSFFEMMSQGQLPQSVNTTAASQSGVPDWYSDYIRGIAARGTELASQADQQPIPQQSIAGFTPDQQQAFAQIRGQQGNWQPWLQGAQNGFDAMANAGVGAQGQANAAVAGPSRNWTDPGTFQKYMSPYTSAVVNEIARLGNQNFSENVMPQINNSMIGAGQFGSTRNAQVLGNAARDNQQNIMGQQASALESGYSTAGNLFNQDAGRAQQQQQMQAATGLQGGALAQQGWQQYAQGNLQQAQQRQQQQLTDAQALQASGQQQQQLQQVGLDTDYNNLVARNQAGWSNLNNLNSIVRGAQLPTSQTAVNNGPLTRTASASPLQTIGGVFSSLAS